MLINSDGWMGRKGGGNLDLRPVHTTKPFVPVFSRSGFQLIPSVHTSRKPNRLCVRAAAD